MASKTIHLVGQYYLTACGKDTKGWANRAERAVRRIRDVTCPHCLALEADDCIKQLDHIKASLRTVKALRTDLADVIEGPQIVRN